MMKNKSFEVRVDRYSDSARGQLCTGRTSTAKKWAAFAAAGVSVGSIQPAEADIIYVDPPDLIVSGTSVYTVIDVDGYNNLFGMGLAPIFAVPRAAFVNAASGLTDHVAKTGGFAINFSSGSPIGPIVPNAIVALLARSSSLGIGGPFFNTTGFVGIAINQGNGDFNFGWIRIGTANLFGPGQTLTVFDWAYETELNTPIAAGAGVPEPSSLALGSLGLLAIGAAGIRNRRKRIREASEV